MNDYLMPVPFYGDTVVLASHDNEPYVVMKPVCENIGVDWKAQLRKLTKKFRSVVAMIAITESDGKQREKKSPPVMVMMTTTGADGKQYQMVALHLRKFPAWVYSIDPDRVAPELRDKIIRYQDECDEVLWQYWTQGVAVNPRARAATIPQQFTAHDVRVRLLDRLETEQHPVKRRALHAQLDHVSRLLGLETPALDSIGHDALPDHENPALEVFWEVVDALEQAGHTLNHARDKSRIALNLPQVRAAAIAARLALPETIQLHRLLRACHAPRFLAVKAVNSAHSDATVKCWVFETRCEHTDDLFGGAS